MTKARFALIGAAGYIAPRHIEAIKSIGGELVLAFDPNDSVGVLDRHFPNCMFFSNAEEFFSELSTRNKTEEERIDFVSVASPNFLHYPQSFLCLELGSSVICEKPLVGSVNDLRRLTIQEHITGQRVFPILQLRLHQQIEELKKTYKRGNFGQNGELTYITSRGSWYLNSWKNDLRKSFGISANIGIHFFDVLCHVFGQYKNSEIHLSSETTATGVLHFNDISVNWHLSIDSKQLPKNLPEDVKTFRQLKINDFEFEFSSGFTELHNLSYSNIVSGKGFDIRTTENAIRIVQEINEKR